MHIQDLMAGIHYRLLYVLTAGRDQIDELLFPSRLKIQSGT